MKPSRALFVICGIVALDAAGIALIFPVLPILLHALTGADEIALLFGATLALYAAMQFFAAPVLGVLSDRFGRRPLLLASLAGSSIDYLIMAFTPHLWLLFIGRAIAGLTAANMAVAIAAIADITPEAERARRFGLLQGCFGAGFVLGPVISVALGDLSLRDPFIAAAVLNGFNFTLALLLLPETHHAEPKRIDFSALNPLIPLRWALSFGTLLPLLAAFLLITLVGQTYSTVWVLFVEDRFHWRILDVALSLAVFGALVAAAQIFAIGPVTRWVGERGTLLLGIACEMTALLILAFAQTSWMVFALIPLLAFGGIGVPALRSLQSRAVDPARQGQLQGVTASIASLAAIFGPVFFSWIYALSHHRWPGLVWLTGVGIFILTVPVILAVPKRRDSIIS